MSLAFGLIVTAMAPKLPPFTTMKPSRPVAMAGSVSVIASVSTQISFPVWVASRVVFALIVTRTVRSP